MATADLITELNTDVNEAYTAIGNKGGTVPPNKNTNNLASAIESIEGGSEQQDYDIPYFDGGQYGAIAYLDENNEIKYYTASSSNSINMVSPGQAGYNAYTVVATGTDKPVSNTQVLAYSFGSEVYTSYSEIGYFGYGMTNLRYLYNLESRSWEQIPSFFLNNCFNFNMALILPSTVTAIENNFLGGCLRFNSSIALPNGLISVGRNFLANCTSFSHSLTFPTSCLSVGEYFLSGCSAFNQPLTFLNDDLRIGQYFLNKCSIFNSPLHFASITSLGDNFLSSCTSFNQPLDLSGITSLIVINNNFLYLCTSFNSELALPSALQTIRGNFLYGCTNFAKSFTLPSSLTTIGSSFMYNCYSFVGSLQIETSAHPSDESSLAVTDAAQYIDSPAYTIGITLNGAGAQTWKNALPDMLADSGSGLLRKLIIVEEPTE